MADTEFDEESLSALISQEIEASVQYDKEEMADARAENLEYLRGEMKDYKPRPNGSTITSRDINDVVAWILPGVVRLFTASNQMVIYEPQEPGDEAYADQATDFINYVFFKDNDGYQVVYNASHDALAVAGDGIVKHWWDDTPVTEVKYLTGLSVEQVAALMEDSDVEILAQEQGEPQTVEMLDPNTGQPMLTEVETWNVKIERTKLDGKIRIEALAPENFLINSEAIDVEDFRFCAHRDPNKTKSDLVKMGFDRKKVEDLPGYAQSDISTEATARRNDAYSMQGGRLKSAQRVTLYECYLKIDVDGDGIAETIRVWYAGASSGGVVLEWDVCEDEVPFSKIPCYPRPHLFNSESAADRAKDIQRVKTVLLRQLLDNLYASALPQREVEEGSVLNPDSLTTPKFGGIIWRKRQSNPIVAHAIPFVADKVVPALQLMDNVLEKRTGVSKTMMALDPEALQNQSATSAKLMHDAAYSQVDLIARNMAEGWRKVFKAVLKLTVRHQERERVIRLRDEFVPIDPRDWNADMDCTINVGLGTGSKDRDMAMLMGVLREQKEMTAGFLTYGAMPEAIDMIPKMVMTAVRSAEAAGLRNADEYFPDIPEERLEELKQQAMAPKPNPEIEKEKIRVQGQIQIEQGKAQVQAQTEQQKLMIDAEAERMKAEGNIAKETAQLQGDIQKERAQLEADIINEQNKLAASLTVEERKIAWEREKQDKELAFKREEMASKEKQAEANAKARAKEPKKAA